MMEQNPFPEKTKKREERETSTKTQAGFPGKARREKKGDKLRNPSRNQKEQQIMMEQRPFLARIENPIQLKSCLGNNDGTDSFFEQRKKDKKRDKKEETDGTSKKQNSWWKDYFLKNTKNRDKKGDNKRNKKRDKPSAGTRAGTSKKQEIRNSWWNRLLIKEDKEPKQEGRQQAKQEARQEARPAPEPEPEPARNRK